MPSPTSISTAKPIYAFIAFGRAPESTVDPTGGTEPLVMRAQTFVRYAPAIKVKSMAPNESGTSVAVSFDGTSVGYSKNLTAHLDINDPGIGKLQNAMNANVPINVGIEARRKNKNRQQQDISRITPIHKLRGANEKGLKATTNDTESNIGANVIAWVDDAMTTECASDPQEWADLVNNTTGLLAPTGWKVITSPEWGEYSFIAHADESGRGGNLDVTALRDLIGDVLYETLVKFNTEDANNIAHTVGGVPTEGQPWKVRTSDGRYNLGHYSHTSFLTVLSWWTKVLRNHPVWSGRPEGGVQHLASNYATHTFELVNQIVESAYKVDGKARWAADPANHSWKTTWSHLRLLLSDALDAAQAGELHIDDLMVFVELDGNGQPTDSSWREWSHFWGIAATGAVRSAGDFLDHFYTEEWPSRRAKSKQSLPDRRGQSQQNRPQQQQRENTTPPSSEQDRPTAAPDGESKHPDTRQETTQPEPQALPGDESIRQSLYNAVRRDWNNSEALGRILMQMEAKDLGTLMVSYALSENKSALTSLTDAQGDGAGPLAMLLQWQIKRLAEQADQASPVTTGGSDAAAHSLGVSVANGNRADEIREQIREATTSEQLDNLAALVNAENLADAEILLDTHPSTIGLYLRFRIKQIGNTSHANAG